MQVVGEFINEVVLVMEYGVFCEDIVRVCYVYLVSYYFYFQNMKFVGLINVIYIYICIIGVFFLDCFRGISRS